MIHSENRLHGENAHTDLPEIFNLFLNICQIFGGFLQPDFIGCCVNTSLKKLKNVFVVQNYNFVTVTENIFIHSEVKL